MGGFRGGFEGGFGLTPSSSYFHHKLLTLANFWLFIKSYLILELTLVAKQRHKSHKLDPIKMLENDMDIKIRKR